MFNKFIQFCTKSKERINTVYWSIIITSIIFTSYGVSSFIESYFGASILNINHSTTVKQTILSLVGLCSVILSLIVYIVVIKTVNSYRFKIYYQTSNSSYIGCKINAIKKRNRIVLQAFCIIISCFIIGFDIYNLINLFKSLAYIKTVPDASYSVFNLVLKIITIMLLIIFNVFILLIFNSACNKWRQQSPVEYNKNDIANKRKYFIVLNSILCSILTITILIVPFGWLMGLRAKSGTYYLSSIEIKNDNISYSQFLNTTQNNFEDMTITLQPAFFNHGRGSFNTFYITEYQNSNGTIYSINKHHSSEEYTLVYNNAISINSLLSENDNCVFVFVKGNLKQFYYHNKELYFIVTFSKTTDFSP